MGEGPGWPLFFLMEGLCENEVVRAVDFWPFDHVFPTERKWRISLPEMEAP